MPPANIDRRVLPQREAKDVGPSSISALAHMSHWTLLGEPGSGKSTAFEQAAADAGTRLVTARDFVEGDRPAGAIVFIDALDEYRIGEAGRDRLYALVQSLKRSEYSSWRIASRAVSLPAPDLLYLREVFPDLEVWQLDALDYRQQIAVLDSIGSEDAAAFVKRVDNMASGPLLGNPATLKLLYATLQQGGAEIHTRGELLERATQEMAYEINPKFPEMDQRPPASTIIRAAEIASTVLVLSARTDIWMGSNSPPGDHAITKDDLLPAGLDTEALRCAVNTPLFKGEAGSFVPLHRMVAEFLAGRALANQVSRVDGIQPALTVDRAIALLSGNDGEIAPSLSGVFGWFVSYLAGGVHSERARMLLEKAPEAILLQGDAALLPTPFRQLLLSAAGRDDPWFLNMTQGSTAVGGLSGTDLVKDFIEILSSRTETTHRKALVLEALAMGRPLPQMVETLEDFCSNELEGGWPP